MQIVVRKARPHGAFHQRRRVDSRRAASSPARRAQNRLGASHPRAEGHHRRREVIETAPPSSHSRAAGRFCRLCENNRAERRRSALSAAVRKALAGRTTAQTAFPARRLTAPERRSDNVRTASGRRSALVPRLRGERNALREQTRKTAARTGNARRAALRRTTRPTVLTTEGGGPYAYPSRARKFFTRWKV